LHCGQHKERTAGMLGMSLKTLYNRLKEYQAEERGERESALQRPCRCHL
jgi:DNA-binding NtrC family response regulator